MSSCWKMCYAYFPIDYDSCTSENIKIWPLLVLAVWVMVCESWLMNKVGHCCLGSLTNAKRKSEWYPMLLCFVLGPEPF